MKGSDTFNLNWAEVKRWLKNAALFSSPLVILALTQFQTTGVVDWKLVAGAAVQIIIDLLRKYLADNTRKVM